MLRAPAHLGASQRLASPAPRRLRPQQLSAASSLPLSCRLHHSANAALQPALSRSSSSARGLRRRVGLVVRASGGDDKESLLGRANSLVDGFASVLPEAVPASLRRPVAIAVSGGGALLLFKAFLSTAVSLGLAAFAAFALWTWSTGGKGGGGDDDDEGRGSGSKGGEDEDEEDPLVRARRIMDKYK